MQELQAEVDALDLPGQEAELAAAQRDLAAAEAEVADLGRAADELAAQEGAYWHAFNDFQARLAAHVDDRDGLLTKARPTGWLPSTQLT